MVTPSLGMCTFTRWPLSTCSQMPVTCPARSKKGRYCFALQGGAQTAVDAPAVPVYRVVLHAL